MSVSRLDEVIDDGHVSGQQVSVVALCFIVNMLDRCDITAMAVVANSVAQDLSLTPGRLGWIFSFANEYRQSYLAASIMCQVPGYDQMKHNFSTIALLESGR